MELAMRKHFHLWTYTLCHLIILSGYSLNGKFVQEQIKLNMFLDCICLIYYNVTLDNCKSSEIKNTNVSVL